MFIRAPGYFILCIANSTPSYFFGISIDPLRIWNLIEFFGLKAMDPLECQLIAFQAGEFISPWSNRGRRCYFEGLGGSWLCLFLFVQMKGVLMEKPLEAAWGSRRN